MKNFNYYVEKAGETGFVLEVNHSLVTANGLSLVRPYEIVVFETGEFGQVLSIKADTIEVLVFAKNTVRVGAKLARTGTFLQIPVGFHLLGGTIDPLGHPLDPTKPFTLSNEFRPVDNTPAGIYARKRINKPCETGVSLVDLIVPLGKGQRELVMGDRKTGKSIFLLQFMLNQARQGVVCIYAAIAKKKLDIKKVDDFTEKNGIRKNVIIVGSSSNDPGGIIFLTPYTAMTLAEYFRDLGKDVLVVLDDLTTHAKFYREIALLGRRFPGRNSYPGDMFYTHARLLERAGNFKTKRGECSITCIPVAEVAQNDLSGYIQTNLMSMTDGHILFDSDLFAKGRRPAVNPFLSVTRVGRQTQIALNRDINRELNSFLSYYERMQSFIHFGAELNESVKIMFAMGERIIAYFNQPARLIIDPRLQVFIFALLWYGKWKDTSIETMKTDMEKLIQVFNTNSTFQKQVVKLLAQSKTLNELLGKLRQSPIPIDTLLTSANTAYGKQTGSNK